MGEVHVVDRTGKWPNFIEMTKTDKEQSEDPFCEDVHCCAEAHIADVLVVTLCETVSLGVWRDCGILAREWSLYEAISPLYRMIVLISDGDEGEQAIADSLEAGCPVRVVANEARLERAAFAGSVPERVHALIESESFASAGGRCERVLIKTDQFWGGSLALAVARRLRDNGVQVGVMARGGYPWSRFVAWEAGSDSLRAIEAAADERALCQQSDLVVGTTEWMLDELAWRYGLGQDTLCCVPNFVPDGARPAPAVKRQSHRVLYAGRLEAQKRVDLLLDACALAADRSAEPLSVDIVGNGSLEVALKEQGRALEAQREDRFVVRFRPRMEQAKLIEMMQQTAVYVQTSAYEGHPKTVLEAMACSTPVVVTDAPGLASVVQAGVTGLIAGSDAHAVAEQIVRVVEAPELALQLGTQAAAAAAAWRFDRVIELERAAHRLAMERALTRRSSTVASAAVRFEPELLDADAQSAAAAWARALHGYSRRLEPHARARFCAAVETPLYDVIDQAALETSGGVHPKHHLMRYHEFFVERIRPGESVLDLGCGYCAVARSIVLKAGAIVTGMDFSRSNLAQANAMIEREGLSDRLTTVYGDITTQRAGDDGQRFDVVVLSNVLEHLADRERLLAQYVRWYRPRVMLIRVPAFDRNWQTAWKAELGIDYRCDQTHETEYTEASLRAELKSAGLGIVELISRWGEYWVQAKPLGVVPRVEAQEVQVVPEGVG